MSEETKQIVAVMPGRLKPYLYFVLRCDALPDSLQQAVESIHCVGMVNTSARTSPSELTMKQSCLSFETSIPTEITITNTSDEKCDAASTVRLTFVALFHINRLAVFN